MLRCHPYHKQWALWLCAGKLQKPGCGRLSMLAGYRQNHGREEADTDPYGLDRTIFLYFPDILR